MSYDGCAHISLRHYLTIQQHTSLVAVTHEPSSINTSLMAIHQHDVFILDFFVATAIIPNGFLPIYQWLSSIL